MVCQTSATFRPRISAAHDHESTLNQARFAKEPMRARSLVNWISGMTANGNCKLKMTWLRIIN